MGDLLGSPRVASLLFVLLGQNVAGIIFFPLREWNPRARAERYENAFTSFFTRSTRTPRPSRTVPRDSWHVSRISQGFFLNAV